MSHRHTLRQVLRYDEWWRLEYPVPLFSEREYPNYNHNWTLYDHSVGIKWSLLEFEISRMHWTTFKVLLQQCKISHPDTYTFSLDNDGDLLRTVTVVTPHLRLNKHRSQRTEIRVETNLNVETKVNCQERRFVTTSITKFVDEIQTFITDLNEPLGSPFSLML